MLHVGGALLEHRNSSSRSQHIQFPYTTWYLSLSLWYTQRDAAALNARESVAFADMTQLGDQLSNVNNMMPESIASIFQHQSSSAAGPQGVMAGKAATANTDANTNTTSSAGDSGGLPDKPPSPIRMPRAQISNGKKL